MNYLLLAEVVMIAHLLLIICILVGILVSARYKRFRPFEAFALLTFGVIWSLYGVCPLTYLESFLRTLAGHPIGLTEAGFIPYYLNSWFDLVVSKHDVIVVTYTLAIIFFIFSFEWISPILHAELKTFKRWMK